MKISILAYDDMAALDAVGPYEVLRCVPGWEVEFVGAAAGPVAAEGGLGLIAARAIADVTDPDIVLVPGGGGKRSVSTDEAVLDWLRSVDRGTRWTVSVCTGALLLGAAGLLDGRRATTHWSELERLREFGAEPVEARYVEDGKLLSAAGVSAGIDMALRLVQLELGPEVAEAVQLGIEYDPAPPVDAGSPAKAPAAIREAVEAVMAAEGQGAAAAAE